MQNCEIDYPFNCVESKVEESKTGDKPKRTSESSTAELLARSSLQASLTDSGDAHQRLENKNASSATMELITGTSSGEQERPKSHLLGGSKDKANHPVRVARVSDNDRSPEVINGHGSRKDLSK